MNDLWIGVTIGIGAASIAQAVNHMLSKRLRKCLPYDPHTVTYPRRHHARYRN